ncbi:MAG TPA: Crp/Fnr family transcriptional regulator [Blastocatellia bacterium]|nr:Crp/Fnr family transcriptional regulator [Blastocatellia bacterium]
MELAIDDLRLTDHNQCSILSSFFRGKLCDQLTARPGRRINANSFIYVIGDRAKSVYFLRKGLIKSSVISEEGEELILRINKTGDIFGEFCLCDNKRREQAIAMEDSEVVEIAFDDLITSLQQNREAMYSFLINVCQRLSTAYDQLRAFSFDKTVERLGRTLLKLSDELGGEETPEGLEIAHYIKQEELAQMIAARREVVSSSLNQLRALGLINYSRKGRLTVKTQALQNYLGAAVTD